MSMLHKVARGRRGVALTAGSVAVLAIAGITGTQAFASQSTHGHAAAAAATSHHRSDTAQRGRSETSTSYPKAGAELAKAVTDVVPGTATDLAGTQDSDPANGTTIDAELTLAPADGSAGGTVSVAFWPEASYGGTGSAAKTRAWLQDCGNKPDCQTSTLPDGSLVRVTSTHQHLSDGTWEINVVERDVDGVVEFVSASAPRDADGTVTSPHAPLTTDQLVDVASRLAPLQ